MEYTLDQTFNYYGEPSTFKEARTTIYCNISYDDDDWEASLLYKAKIREGTCEDLYRYDAEFQFVFSNSTREINKIIREHEEWDLKEKHPSFYSGTNFGKTELFLIDEMMLLQGEVGIIQKAFNFMGNTSVELSGKKYATFKYRLNTIIPLTFYL